MRVKHFIEVKKIMSKNPISIDYEQDMLMASKVMMDHRIRHLLVFKKGNLVGILSDRDVSRAMHINQIIDDKIELSLNSTLKIPYFMSWPVYTIKESTKIKTAIENMLLQKVSALVVENDEGKITGIVTTEDLMGYLLIQLEKEEYHQLVDPTENDG